MNMCLTNGGLVAAVHVFDQRRPRSRCACLIYGGLVAAVACLAVAC